MAEVALVATVVAAAELEDDMDIMVEVMIEVEVMTADVAEEDIGAEDVVASIFRCYFTILLASPGTGQKEV